MALSPLRASWGVIQDWHIDRQLSHSKGFNDAITNEVIQQTAAKLVQAMEACQASLEGIIDESDLNLQLLKKIVEQTKQFQTIACQAGTSENLSNPDKLLRLSQCHLLFTFVHETFLHHGILTPVAWERQQLPGVLSFVPELVVTEIAQFLVNHVFVDQRTQGQFALLLSVLGGIGAPLLRDGVEGVNYLLTGKSLEHSGVASWIIMTFVSYKGFLTGLSINQRHESIWYEVINLLKADPVKNLGAIALLVTVGMAHVTEPYIKFMRFLACDCRLGKIPAFKLFTKLLQESYEAEKLAGFPYFELFVVALKQLGVLHSLFVKDHPIPKEAFDDPEIARKYIQQAQTWFENNTSQEVGNTAGGEDHGNVQSRFAEFLSQVTSAQNQQQDVHTDAREAQNLEAQDASRLIEAILPMTFWQQFAGTRKVNLTNRQLAIKGGAPSSGTRKRWFKKVNDIIQATNLSAEAKDALLRRLYRGEVVQAQGRLTHMSVQVFHGLISMMSYPLVVLGKDRKSLVHRSIEGQFSNPKDAIVNNLMMGVSGAFNFAFFYWLLIYDKDAHFDGECISPATCLDASGNEFELIEQCLHVLTECACVEPNTFHSVMSTIMLGTVHK